MLKRVNPQKNYKLTGSTFNTIADFVNKIQDPQKPPKPDIPLTNIVKIKNSTGGDLDQFAIVKADAPLFPAADNEDVFLANVSIDCIAPVANEQFLVTLEPIIDGEIGLAMASGLISVKVSGAKTEAVVCTSSTTQLTTADFTDLADGVFYGTILGGVSGGWAICQFPFRKSSAGGEPCVYCCDGPFWWDINWYSYDDLMNPIDSGFVSINMGDGICLQPDWTIPGPLVFYGSSVLCAWTLAFDPLSGSWKVTLTTTFGTVYLDFGNTINFGDGSSLAFDAPVYYGTTEHVGSECPAVYYGFPWTCFDSSWVEIESAEMVFPYWEGPPGGWTPGTEDCENGNHLTRYDSYLKGMIYTTSTEPTCCD